MSEATEIQIGGQWVYMKGMHATFVTRAGHARWACTYCMANSFKVRVARYVDTEEGYMMCNRCSGKGSQHFQPHYERIDYSQYDEE